eukprot:1140108-Prorocentrum_minimum.AAC.1
MAVCSNAFSIEIPFNDWRTLSIELVSPQLFICGRRVSVSSPSSRAAGDLPLTISFWLLASKVFGVWTEGSTRFSKVLDSHWSLKAFLLIFYSATSLGLGLKPFYVLPTFQ